MCQVWVQSLTLNEKVDVEQHITEMIHISNALGSVWKGMAYFSFIN